VHLHQVTTFCHFVLELQDIITCQETSVSWPWWSCCHSTQS